MHAKSLQSCPILCDPMDCSLPGSSVHGILQARKLKWVAISFPRGKSSWPRVQTPFSCIDRPILYHWEAQYGIYHILTDNKLLWKDWIEWRNERETHIAFKSEAPRAMHVTFAELSQEEKIQGVWRVIFWLVLDVDIMSE